MSTSRAPSKPWWWPRCTAANVSLPRVTSSSVRNTPPGRYVPTSAATQGSATSTATPATTMRARSPGSLRSEARPRTRRRDDREPERERHAERRDGVHHPGVEISLVDDARPGDDCAQHDRRAAHEPPSPREAPEGGERRPDRHEGDREVHEHERPREAALESAPGHVVELRRLEPRVRREDRKRDRSPQRPGGEYLSLPGNRVGQASAARSASTTYDWSSAPSRAWNGRASVRALSPSATGHMPSENPYRSRM